MTCLLDIENFDASFMEKIKEAEKKIFITDKLLRGNRYSLCGRILLGYMLKKYYGINSFSYRYGKNGKPYLENEDIFFNISHSGNFVLCTLSDKETGCDIEKIKDYNPRVAKRFFSAREAELLENKETEDCIFARLWTLKESILKKEGTGISGGLDTYCFADYAEKEEFSVYGYNFLNCQYGEYMLSICSETLPEKPLNVTKKEIEEYTNEINSKNT